MGTLFMLLRSFLSLAVVLGLALLIARALKSRQILNLSKSTNKVIQSPFRVEAKIQTSKNHQLLVVNFDGQRLLVGQGPAGITLISKAQGDPSSQVPLLSTENNSEVMNLSGVSSPEDLILNQWGKGKFLTPNRDLATARMSFFPGLRGMLKN
jgi:flagellar biogenesis protein FliO